MDPLPDNAIIVTVAETLPFAPRQIIELDGQSFKIHAIIDATQLWVTPCTV